MKHDETAQPPSGCSLGTFTPMRSSGVLPGCRGAVLPAFGEGIPAGRDMMSRGGSGWCAVWRPLSAKKHLKTQTKSSKPQAPPFFQNLFCLALVVSLNGGGSGCCFGRVKIPSFERYGISGGRRSNGSDADDLGLAEGELGT